MLLLLLVLAAAVTLALSPFFNINDFIVTGNQRVATEEILAASQIAVGTNALRVDYKGATQRIYNLPSVSTVKVSHKFPDKIRITITESTPKAYVEASGGYVAVDETGKTIELVTAETMQELPVFTGITAGEIVLGGMLQAEAEHIDLLCEYIGHITANRLDLVRLVDISDPNNVKMTLASGLVVNFGDNTDMGYKAAYLKSAIKEIGTNAQGQLDISDIANGAPYRAEVPAEEAPAEEGQAE